MCVHVCVCVRVRVRMSGNFPVNVITEDILTKHKVLICPMCLCRFDAELSAARDETSQERISKEQVARDKATMKSDMDLLQQELNVSYSQLYMHTRTYTQYRIISII